MNNIDSTRSSFFPQTDSKTSQARRANKISPKGNTYEKQKYIDNYTARDAKVDIPDAIKDFAKIKRAVDMAPDRDNSAKIEALKKSIEAGTYKVDPDALADKILSEEFAQ